MKRRFFGIALVVLIGFVATSCATGRYLGPNPYPGELGQVVAGSLALTCPGDYYVGSPVNQCLGQLMRGIGRNTDPRRYAGYPMYRGGPSGPQLSTSTKVAILAGIAGAGVAGLSGAGGKTVLGVGIGAAIAGKVIASRGKKSSEVMVESPYQPGVVYDRQGRAIAQSGSNSGQSRFFGNETTANCLDFEMFTLRNETREVLRVYQNGKPFTSLKPGDKFCADPQAEYTAEMFGAVVGGQDGYTARAESRRTKPIGFPGGVWVWR